MRNGRLPAQVQHEIARLAMILPAVDAFNVNVVSTFRVDPDHVYLTGLSMGGFGVVGARYRVPASLRGGGPICGGGRRLLDFPERLKRIVHLPVWSFHGDRDEEIPLEESVRLVDALRQYGGNLRSTVYTGVGHDSWTQTYENPELYGWFLQHVRSNSLDDERRGIALTSLSASSSQPVKR